MFDVAAAKKEGYSDAEIVDYLAKDKKFDAAAARSEGYSDAELLSHLTSTPPKAKPSLLLQAKNALVEDLPMLGQGIGGALGVMGGLGTPAAVPLGIGGAALGQATGQTAKDYLTGNQPTTYTEGAIRRTGDALAGGIGQMAGDLAERVITPLVAPMAAKVRTAAGSAAESFGKLIRGYDAPFSPANYAPNWLSKSSQWLADKFLPSSVATGQARTRLSDLFMGLREEALGKAGGAVENPIAAGERLVAGLKDAKTEGWILGNKKNPGIVSVAQEGYQAVTKEAGGPDVLVPMPRLKAALEELGGTSGVWNPEQRAFLGAFADAISSGATAKKNVGKIPFSKLQEFQGQIWTQLRGADEKLAGKVWQALNDDLATWDAAQGTKVVELMAAAKDNWTTALELASKKIPMLRTLLKNKPNYVVSDALRTGNLGQLRMIGDVLEKSGRGGLWNDTRAQFLQYVFDQSSNREGTFLPGLYARRYTELQPQLATIFRDKPEVVQLLGDIAEMGKKSGYESKRMGGDLMSKVAQFGALTGLGGWGAAQRPMLAAAVAVPSGFSYLMARSLMNPSGWVHRWMTNATTNALVPLTGQAVRSATSKGLSR